MEDRHDGSMSPHMGCHVGCPPAPSLHMPVAPLSCAANTCIHKSATHCIYSCWLLDAVKPSMLYMYVFISPATMPGRARALPRGPQDPARSYKSGTRARVDLHTDPDSRNVYMRILAMSTRFNCTPPVCGSDESHRLIQLGGMSPVLHMYIMCIEDCLPGRRRGRREQAWEGGLHR